jgi:hypothetical protein
MIDHSYQLVVANLPRAVRNRLHRSDQRHRRPTRDRARARTHVQAAPRLLAEDGDQMGMIVVWKRMAPSGEVPPRGQIWKVTPVSSSEVAHRRCWVARS